MKKKQAKHKLIVPLFYDYHLFGYAEDLILKLAEHGFEVFVITADPRIIDKFTQHDEKICVIKSFHVRLINKFFETPYLRALAWIYGWIWSFFATLGYEAIVLPRDTHPLQYLVSFWKSSILIQPALGKYTKLYLSYKYGLQKTFVKPQIGTNFPVIDKLFGGGYLQSVHQPMASKVYAVIGQDSKHFYEDLGVSPNKVCVVGNPNYEGLKLYNKNDSKLTEIKEIIGFEHDAAILSFFPSQLIFSEEDVAALSDFITAMSCSDDKILFLIKPHPRVNDAEILKLKQLNKKSSEQNVRTVILDNFPGEDNNVRIISMSDAVLVEESNVGIMAAYFGKPLFVLKLLKDKANNFFKLFHIPEVSKDNISFEIQRIRSDACPTDKQDIMIENIAKRLESPHMEIVKLLQNIIQK